MNPNMKAHLKDQLLMTLMHYLPMDVRKKVMMEVPAAYCDFYGGKPNVVVCYANDKTVVTAEENQRTTIFRTSE